MNTGSETIATRVDGDIVSRFATCCKALGLSVFERRRPADLAAARSGFAALTRVAHDQCDAWIGLAAAGDVSPGVLAAVSATAGATGAACVASPAALLARAAQTALSE